VRASELGNENGLSACGPVREKPWAFRGRVGELGRNRPSVPGGQLTAGDMLTRWASVYLYPWAGHDAQAPFVPWERARLSARTTPRAGNRKSELATDHGHSARTEGRCHERPPRRCKKLGASRMDGFPPPLSRSGRVTPLHMFPAWPAVPRDIPAPLVQPAGKQQAWPATAAASLLGCCY
jgi:hypothetical protein